MEIHVKNYSRNDHSEISRRDASTEPKGVATSVDNFSLPGPRKRVPLNFTTLRTEDAG